MRKRARAKQRLLRVWWKSFTAISNDPRRVTPLNHPESPPGGLHALSSPPKEPRPAGPTSRAASGRDKLNCLAATNVQRERHHPRGVSLRLLDLPGPGRERRRQCLLWWRSCPWVAESEEAPGAHSCAVVCPRRRGP